MDCLMLPDRKCKVCKHLDSLEKTAYSCYDKPFCPAKEVQIITEDKVMKAVKAFKAAQFEGNLGLQQSILATVAKQSRAFIQRFNETMINGSSNS